MMDIFVLDENYSEIEIIDQYISLIWTERFNTPGDFELHMAPSDRVRDLLVEGTLLASSESNRLMVVEKIVDKPAEQGRLVVFSGRSIESLLDNRVGRVDGASGSTKSWLNQLVRNSMIDGNYSSSDKINNLSFGTDELYPPSTIPPSTAVVPRLGSGWTGLMKAHDTAKDMSPLGFRIVRRPFSKKLYYDNYTGNDRSGTGVFDEIFLDLSFRNPYFYEVDNDVEVWRNISNNPGFTNGQRALTDGAKLIEGGPELKEVDVSWSKSGKGLMIPSPENGNPDAARTWMTGAPDSLNSNYLGTSWWGKTLTISAKVEVVRQLSGTQHGNARRITAYVVKGSQTLAAADWHASNQAPNSIGVHNVSLTVTLPSPGNSEGYVSWALGLWNGNGVKDDGNVIWGDFCVMEHSSNPIGYFDSENSPDSDLFSDWVEVGSKGTRVSVLKGRVPQGISKLQSRDCVIVQSRNWSNVDGGTSARMINNTGVMQHYTEISMRSDRPMPKYWDLVRYQSEVFGIVSTTHFGRIDLKRYATTIAMSPVKANIVQASRFIANSAGGYNTIVLWGGHQKLGGSLYYDNFITSVDPILWPTDTGVNKPVIFSEDMDSFIVESSYLSIENYANVVYVTRGDTVLKIDDGYSSLGARRRVIHVDADNLADGPMIRSEMEALGVKALSENLKENLIDGGVPPYSAYKYDVDYALGDLVMVYDQVGGRMTARVMEQIFVSDQNGFKTYPTLREEYTTTVGVWHAPEYKINWTPESLGDWADQP